MQRLNNYSDQGIYVCWYPQENNLATHVHLRINYDKIARIYFSCKCRVHLFDLNDATESQNSYVERINRYEFKIRANLQQISEIYHYLNKKKPDLEWFTCSSSTCMILNRFNLLSVPFLISLSPGATASYLFRQHVLGNPQIKNIKFIGENPNSLSIRASPAIICEVIIVIATAVFASFIVFEMISQHFT